MHSWYRTTTAIGILSESIVLTGPSRCHAFIKKITEFSIFLCGSVSDLSPSILWSLVVILTTFLFLRTSIGMGVNCSFLHPTESDHYRSSCSRRVRWLTDCGKKMSTAVSFHIETCRKAQKSDISLSVRIPFTICVLFIRSMSAAASSFRPYTV